MLFLILVFLGEVEKNRLKDIEVCMKEACKGHKASQVTVKGFGKFVRNGEVLYWRGMECSHDILALRQDLITQLKLCRFRVDQKPFKPHITLVRRCVMSETFSNKEYEKTLITLNMLVDKIYLMKSERINGQMVYTKVAEETMKKRR